MLFPMVGSRVPRDRGHAGRVPLPHRSVFKQVEQEKQERPEAKHLIKITNFTNWVRMEMNPKSVETFCFSCSPC